jgi:hypothetical protein
MVWWGSFTGTLELEAQFKVGRCKIKPIETRVEIRV